MTDVHGAVTLPSHESENSPEYSMEALKRACDIVNVDRLLEDDTELMYEFKRKQRELLESAGYRPEALEMYDTEIVA